MSDADPSRTEDDSRVEALRRARQRRPWTDDLLAEAAADPGAFKARTPACSACPEPCEADEVCATAVAKSDDLFEAMGRDQAFHLLENGMKRLRVRDDAGLRTADRERPNTFLRLDGAGENSESEGGGAAVRDGNDERAVESRDERRTNPPDNDE